ncbi:hypothetical protein FB45DRAFT_798866 [Roridomyces roridus]|uniref:Tetraspanin n=1 Tax=Roridomyces roridus TaxID=1738132 RepID=A0AAD7BHB2_9AGAR|nr:hypothetical protein FB45DRAFT_234001 [Roridomyces roridus]KAJ7621142.1 hypothetical protein FB45DRAFT_798866 [Roridomyces roridus]
MAYVQTRTFCCCLPVRFGVLVMSLIALLGGGLVAVGGVVEIKRLDEHIITESHKPALYVVTAIFSLLALLGAFGLFGVLARNTAAVSTFSSALSLHLGFSIGTGIFSIYTVFKRNSDAAISNCIQNSTDPSKIKQCHTDLDIAKGLIIGIFLVAWVVELYGCIIAANYVRQLKEEEMAKGTAVNPNAYIPNAPMTTYAPPPGAYAFTQPNQALGHQV